MRISPGRRFVPWRPKSLWKTGRGTHHSSPASSARVLIMLLLLHLVVFSLAVGVVESSSSPSSALVRGRGPALLLLVPALLHPGRGTGAPGVLRGVHASPGPAALVAPAAAAAAAGLSLGRGDVLAPSARRRGHVVVPWRRRPPPPSSIVVVVPSPPFSPVVVPPPAASPPSSSALRFVAVLPLGLLLLLLLLLLLRAVDGGEGLLLVAVLQLDGVAVGGRALDLARHAVGLALELPARFVEKKCLILCCLATRKRLCSETFGKRHQLPKKI